MKAKEKLWNTFYTLTVTARKLTLLKVTKGVESARGGSVTNVVTLSSFCGIIFCYTFNCFPKNIFNLNCHHVGYKNILCTTVIILVLKLKNNISKSNYKSKYSTTFEIKLHNISYIADLGKARGGSKNTFEIKSFDPTLPPLALWRHQAQKVRDNTTSHRIDYVAQV